ncbi:hypothetical protein VNI00_010875 [Paramarasmius palmivorus]|uniref:Uncharacterized protein n=1 Tax=Paramarasmius palmivorus TaxID=297713 RepID=A0AAW0CEZ7_9AGAR
MARKRIYTTGAQKKEANRLKSARYYKNHKDDINARRRLVYHITQLESRDRWKGKLNAVKLEEATKAFGGLEWNVPEVNEEDHKPKTMDPRILDAEMGERMAEASKSVGCKERERLFDKISGGTVQRPPCLNESSSFGKEIFSWQQPRRFQSQGRQHWESHPNTTGNGSVKVGHSNF